MLALLDRARHAVSLYKANVARVINVESFDEARSPPPLSGPTSEATSS